jgi:hypothetical protein
MYPSNTNNHDGEDKPILLVERILLPNCQWSTTAKLPTYGSGQAAGLDLYANENKVIKCYGNCSPKLDVKNLT